MASFFCCGLASLLWVIIGYSLSFGNDLHGIIGGFIKELGAVDFAGGNVVHISLGVSGLVACIILGKRRGYGMISYKPHNIPFVVLGAGLLYFVWFGFNAGSAL